jgi:hypothetical protein
MTRASDGTGRLWTWVAIGATLALAVAVDIINRQLVIGSPEGGWAYPYVGAPDARWFQFFLVASLVTGTAVAASWPWLIRLGDDLASDRKAWTLILTWCLLAVGIQGMLRSLTAHSLESLFTSDMSSSFYGVALRFDAGEILGQFERRRPTWPLHAKSNLPGKLLLLRGLMHLSGNPQVLAWLIVVLSSLGAVLLYLFVRDLFGDRQFAVVSAILYLFTPAKFYFLPLMNTVTPVAVLACGVLLVRWLGTGRSVFAALLGAGVYGLALFEPTALISGVLFAIIVGRAVVTGSISVRSLVLHVAVGIVAFLVTHAMMLFWFGFDLVDSFRDVAADAVAFNVEARRPYDIWVRQNLFDFALGVGLCQVALFAGALVNSLGQLKIRRYDRSAASIVLVCAGIIAMVGLADGLGVNRGEVIRLWIFLACLSQIPAAYICRRIGHPMALVTVLTLTMLQNTLGTAMIAFVVP